MSASHGRLIPIALVLAAAACGSDPDVPGSDAGADASLDVRSDAKVDGSVTDGTTPDATDSATADVALDAPKPCNGSTTGQCGAGAYCDAIGCGLGTCKPAPAETNTLSAVCGCDGVTYWNATVAENKGVTPNTSGECAQGKTCGGIASLKCPAGTNCNFHLQNKGACAISDATGTCWGLPAQCPTVVIGPLTRQCNSLKCTEQCSLIKAGVTWFDDVTCPQ